MKRTVSLILAVVMLAGMLTGCGSKVEASEKGTSIARSAIQIADDYLDNEITGDRAMDKLDELSEKMEYLDSMPRDTDEENSQYLADFGISTDLTMLAHEILFDKNGENRYDKIIEIRNDLAETIGDDKR